jgi:hypothetical protein
VADTAETWTEKTYPAYLQAARGDQTWLTLQPPTLA